MQTGFTTKAGTHCAQAVIFDLDGVLMDSEWLAFQAWQELAAAHGGKLSKRCFSGMVGLSQENTALYVMEKSGAKFGVAEASAYIWQAVIAGLAQQIEPLPGAVDLVRTLAERGVPLAIASNGYKAYIDSALDGLRLSGHFPVRVGIDQVAEGKPAPDVYLRAAQELGVDPQRCLAVEDLRVGMQAAYAAGLRVIAVPDQRDPEYASGFDQAWQVYPSLVQVKSELEMLLALNEEA